MLMSMSNKDLAVHRMSMLEILEVMQGLFAVEQPDVARLRRSESAHGPAQVNKMRLDRSVHRMHSDLARQAVRLASVARAACGDDVRPLVRAATRQRNEVIARERFARLQLDLKPAAVLAAVAIAREEERVGDLAAESAGDVNEPRQPDDCRARKRESLGADHLVVICLDDLGLSVNDQP